MSCGALLQKRAALWIGQARPVTCVEVRDCAIRRATGRAGRVQRQGIWRTWRGERSGLNRHGSESEIGTGEGIWRRSESVTSLWRSEAAESGLCADRARCGQEPGALPVGWAWALAGRTWAQAAVRLAGEAA